MVVGIDLSPRMLDVAGRLIAKRGWNNVTVHEADAARLPFADETFEKVLCTFALNIIPAYERAVEEIRRVLVHGGLFVALEVRSGPHSTPGWFHRLAPICAVDVTHETLDAIRRMFPAVQVRFYWRNMLFLAVAAKEQASSP